MYKGKYCTKRDTNPEEIRGLLTKLENFRNDINASFAISFYRTKITDNIRGLIDCLRKAEKKSNEQLMKEIEFLRKENEELKEENLKIYQDMALTNVKWNNTSENHPQIEYPTRSLESIMNQARHLEGYLIKDNEYNER